VKQRARAKFRECLSSGGEIPRVDSRHLRIKKVFRGGPFGYSFADLETGQAALKASMKVVRGHFRWQENKRFNPAGFHRYDTILVLECP
jgi:hypothetical protein